DRDEVGLDLAPLQELGVARLEEHARRPVEGNLLHVLRGDVAVGIDRVHQGGADEPLERHRIDPGSVGQEMKRRVHMRAGMTAHRDGGRVRVVAAAHAPPLVHLHRRRDDPAHRVGREIERDVVVLHGAPAEKVYVVPTADWLTVSPSAVASACNARQPVQCPVMMLAMLNVLKPSTESGILRSMTPPRCNPPITVWMGVLGNRALTWVQTFTIPECEQVLNTIRPRPRTFATSRRSSSKKGSSSQAASGLFRQKWSSRPFSNGVTRGISPL